MSQLSSGVLRNVRMTVLQLEQDLLVPTACNTCHLVCCNMWGMGTLQHLALLEGLAAWSEWQLMVY